MNILCLSASNSRKAVEDSVSFKVCQIAARQLETSSQPMESQGRSAEALQVEIASLQHFDLLPCSLCGHCAETGSCVSNPDFNALFERMRLADKLLFVVPHYSPLPSKLMALFEKINEIAYAGWLKDPSTVSPLADKPFAVIGHGGMTETPEVLSYYQEAILKPVSRTLRSLGLHWCAGEHFEGAVFGLSSDSCLKALPEAIFPDILIEEDRIAMRIQPVIQALAQA